MRDPPEGDLYSFSHGDINICDLDWTGLGYSDILKYGDENYWCDVDQEITKVIYDGGVLKYGRSCFIESECCDANTWTMYRRGGCRTSD